MTIIASCGHPLADADGEDGMGWKLTTRSYSRECTPAASYGSYCTSCRDAALAQPGLVLRNDAEVTAWLATP